VHLVGAVFAFAGGGAAHSRVEAFAVAFLAVRFLAVTSFFCQTAVAQSSFFDRDFGCVDLAGEEGGVFAGGAAAVLSADFARAETLAVHFEAEGLLAAASGFLFLVGVGEGWRWGELACEGVVFLVGGGGVLLGGL
jgi:hypothetical protein